MAMQMQNGMPVGYSSNQANYGIDKQAAGNLQKSSEPPMETLTDMANRVASMARQVNDQSRVLLAVLGVGSQAGNQLLAPEPDRPLTLIELLHKANSHLIAASSEMELLYNHIGR